MTARGQSRPRKSKPGDHPCPLAPKAKVGPHFCGADRIKGYHAEEIIGEHLSRFYTQEDQREGVPMRALARFKPVRSAAA